MPTPSSIDLSGRWLVRLDADDRGAKERWYDQTAEATGWRPIAIPSAFQHELGADFRGIAWLRRRIELPTEWEHDSETSRLWLCCEAVATDCTAWVNGREVGRHLGDWLPFQFEITDAVNGVGALEVVLRVDQVPAAPPAQPGDLQHGHITKGFHDVISIQHAGVWLPCSIVRTGGVSAIPNGISVIADPDAGTARVAVELEPHRCGGQAAVTIFAPDGSQAAARRVDVTPGAGTIEVSLAVPDAVAWRPESPVLYRCRVELESGGRAGDVREVRFGFRRAEVRGRQIILNGRPLLARGVLDWGHEPKHIAPAPTPDEVRARFLRLRDMGFSCVCLCMWYPPSWFYDIADEMGMLIWQEHPVWQSSMADGLIEEYRRLYQGFMRRDVNHPSVIIVSATCEHPCFHPRLAEWWWDEARRRLPDRLLQLQTAFFRWADLERTDLHDEHTYDNSNRWVGYLEDVQHHLESLPAKPFVMGETIVFTSWPEVDAYGAAAWWQPRCLDSQRRIEADLSARYGVDIVSRLRRQGDRFHLLGRKFQVEQFRRYAGHAGMVMNHLRDVPQCQCGFMDDRDRWRFEPADTRPWLGDVALLLVTPDQRRAFSESGDGIRLDVMLAVSNFGERAVDAHLTVRAILESEAVFEVAQPVRVECGDVGSSAWSLPLPEVSAPECMRIEAEIPGTTANAWDLWLFPGPSPAPGGTCRLDGLPFAPRDAEPDDVECGYSRGYGLPVRNWTCVLPDPAVIAPKLPPWRAYERIPADTRVILTHKLTERLLDFAAHGGRLVLLASKTEGGLGTRYEWLFGSVPLVIEEGPIGAGDSEWIVDLLGYDLVRRYCRVIPVEDLGIAEDVDPLIRLLYTHDQARVRSFDLLFQARVGDGLLIASSLDHSEPAGRYLLDRALDYAAGDDLDARSALDPERLRPLAIG